MYVPPAQSRFYNEDAFYTFENDIHAKCSEYKYCILLGDINGYTSNAPDYIVFDEFQTKMFDIDENLMSEFNFHKYINGRKYPSNQILQRF